MNTKLLKQKIHLHKLCTRIRVNSIFIEISSVYRDEIHLIGATNRQQLIINKFGWKAERLSSLFLHTNRLVISEKKTIQFHYSFLTDLLRPAVT